MSFTKWIAAAVVLLAAAGGLWWYMGMPGWNQIALTPAEELQKNPPSSRTDASDSALAQDQAAIDAQINGFASDSTAIQASLNDEPIEQDY